MQEDHLDIQVQFYVNHKKVGNVRLAFGSTAFNVLVSAHAQGFISEVLDMMTWKVLVDGRGATMETPIRDTNLVDFYQ